MIISDEILIEGCKKGKHSAFEALYNKYAMRMMAIAQRYCNTTFEGEDVLQEAFIKVFNKINSFDGKGSLEGWLKRIVINTAINHYHQTYKDKGNIDYDTAMEQDSKLPDAISMLSNDELLNIIRDLPEGYRMVFNLYAIEGYSHQEIADILNINEGTSKSQLSKARNMIKELLYKYNSVNL